MSKPLINLNDHIVEFNPIEDQMKIFNGIDLSVLPDPDMIPQSIKDMEKKHDDLLKNLPTPEERMKPLTDRMDSMKSELIIQTNELQKLRYENTKLNAQIEVLNITNDKQLSEIKSQQSNITQLKTINRKLQSIIDDSKWSNLKSLFIGVIGTVIADFLIRFIVKIITNL